MSTQAFSGVLTKDGKILQPGSTGLPPAYAAERLARVFGTEEDPVNCSWFFKVGACRKGETCPKKHNQPTGSETLLLSGLYQGTPQAIAIANELPWDDEMYDVAQAHVEQFYEDVFLTVAEYGEVEEVVILDNTTPNLFGNVYVKYYHEDSARLGLRGLTGRYYNGRLINAEFTPVADFREARCRTHHEKRCNLVGTCGFMHMKHIPRALKKRAVQAMYKAHPEYMVKNKRDRRADNLPRPGMALRDEFLLPGEMDSQGFVKGKGKSKGKGKEGPRNPAEKREMTLRDMFMGGDPTKPKTIAEEAAAVMYSQGLAEGDDLYDAYDDQEEGERPRLRRRRRPQQGEYDLEPGMEPPSGSRRRRFREYNPEDEFMAPRSRRRRARDPYMLEEDTEETAAERAAAAKKAQEEAEEQRIANEKKAAEDKAAAIKAAAARTAADIQAAQQLALSIAGAEKAAQDRSAARKAEEMKAQAEAEAQMKAAAAKAAERAATLSAIEAERAAQAKRVAAERLEAQGLLRAQLPQDDEAYSNLIVDDESEEEVVLG